MKLHNLRALVIENHSEPTNTVRDFCTNALGDHMFRRVEYWCNALHDTLELMMIGLLKSDAIVIQSQWLYKDQLEMFVNALVNHPELQKKQFVFFIWHLLNTANDWVKGKGVSDFEDLPAFLENLKVLVARHQVYSVSGMTPHIMFNHNNGSFTSLKAHMGTGLY